MTSKVGASIIISFLYDTVVKFNQILKSKTVSIQSWWFNGRKNEKNCDKKNCEKEGQNYEEKSSNEDHNKKEGFKSLPKGG